MKRNIIFEDKHLLVLYKPAGVPVQSAGSGVQDCESILKNYLREKAPEKGVPYLGIVHRLDQPVEGLLVFAKTPFAASALSRQVRDKTMKKRYLAIRLSVDNSVHEGRKAAEICGEPRINVDNSVEKWTKQVDFLRKQPGTNGSEIVREGTPGAKRAVLRYRILDRRDGLELLEIELLTGRHHQIRVQMAGLGTPLLGDRKYAGAALQESLTDQPFPALCASFLELVHPRTGKGMIFEKRPENPAFLKFEAALPRG